MWIKNYYSNLYALYHHGIKGQKWGVRRTPEELGHVKKSIAKSSGNSIIEDAIASGKVSKNVNPDKQKRHLRHGHLDGRSYIDGDLEYAQALIDELSGTGQPLIGSNGSWNSKERVSSSHIIGTHVAEDGAETKSNNGIIVYSKTGSHIYPAEKEKKENGA